MKYLFCLPRFHTNVVPWVRILKDAGHELALDVAGKGPTENWDLVKPTIHSPSWLCRVMMKRKLRGPDPSHHVFPSVVRYWKHLARENPDIVIVRGLTRWFPRIVAVIALLQRRKLVVYDQEDVCPARWSGTWFRRSVLQIIGVPHISPRLKAGSLGSNLGCAVVLPFGCPFAEVETSPSKIVASDVPRILMVAKYRERKGHLILLQALGKIAAEVPFTVTFCGEEAGYEDRAFIKDLLAKAELNSIRTRLQICNNVPHRDMYLIYRTHDLMILPSRMEGAGMSPIEAAWCGCATLVPSDSGTRGYFPEGDAFEFDPGDANDIASSILRVIKDRQTLQSHKERCRLHIEAVSGKERIASIFESLF
jgi:glycosyltransferase involved in cell wall biosynthesis